MTVVRRVKASVVDRVRRIRRDLVALYLAGRDPRTPLLARFLAVCVVAYALSPIDLIPDFIPVIGLLDDLLLVPLGLALVVRLIPPALMAEFRAQAEQSGRPGPSRMAAAMIVGLWICLAVLAGLWVWRRIGTP